ncbi:hypothetical protein LTR36_010954 [Oleoguttula mirabilis]|uniref:C2 domain-containing protein n=1 Tax=Oleoguttula mirabilis TaxID=1507867 RepID=A0AAV9J3S0_9PEZI|nr:hypothetical protein LTR36_010954 [Oleoguttula mirabilis]
MATKLVSNAGPHAAGIFSDMTVDGPEIGTLVLIVDRGKNLPNRRTMGKQSAYCAARLGKEAKKTETDKRGGQTPKWDQELRYTVHDSPDYYNLKISVFSEDKRTDLVGEAWVSLNDVIVAGGGKNDMWQGLHCKGKYAGEIRIELTYYDSRPKPEKEREESVAGEDEAAMRQSVGTGSRVKRRPLPTNPNGSAVTPGMIPEPAVPGRAKHGPRDYRTPSRANSTPPEMSYQHQQLHSLYGNQAPQQAVSHGSSPQAPSEPAPPNQYYDEPQPYPEQAEYEEPYQEPDFLPQLPPTTRQRPVPQQRFTPSQAQPLLHQPRPHSHIGLTHSHSAPMVPQSQMEPQEYDDGYQLRTDYPEPIPDMDYQHGQLRQRRDDVPPGWQEEYGDTYAPIQPELEDEPGPPPPPMHSISAPVVPRFAPSPTGRYGSAPPNSTRHHSVPNASPLQGSERGYGSANHTPIRGQHPRGRSVDEYGSSPEQISYGNTPPSLVPGQAPSPYARGPVARALPSRHSVADPYSNTPPRPHPLSQEVPRARSPLPEMPTPYNQPQYQQEYEAHGAPLLIKPRAVSPHPAPLSQPGSRPRSAYSLQHPVRSFESSDNSPLSTSQSNPRLAHIAGHTLTTRKSVSPRPSFTDAGLPGVPFSPDSFDVHNPNVRPSPLAASSHTPYHVPSSAESRRTDSNGPIVGWHGQEIDPSDHLPVDSWAPEPEKKTPTKTYGVGRDRDFGPRTSQGVATAGGRVSKDTVINVRMKSAEHHEPSPPAAAPAGRNRLIKKNGVGPGRNAVPVEPLSEHDNYNAVSNHPYAPPQQEYEYAGGPHRGYAAGGSQPAAAAAYGAPPGVPPKVPVPREYEQEQGHGYGYGYEYEYEYEHEHEYGPGPGAEALSREISRIDIGSGSRSSSRQGGRPANGSGSVPPPPTAYVPVKSHQDRRSYY